MKVGIKNLHSSSVSFQLYVHPSSISINKVNDCFTATKLLNLVNILNISGWSVLVASIVLVQNIWTYTQDGWTFWSAVVLYILQMRSSQLLQDL